jgi:mannose-6-phosphate isomerase-like protein (cupin superfamily)
MTKLIFKGDNHQMFRRISIPPDEGHSVDLGGVGVHFKIRGEETGGAFAVVEHPVAPCVVVEPHSHQHEDEFSYVLEGIIGVRIGDEEFEAGPGTYIVKPRGILHTFWNPGPHPARLIEIISPAGFEHFFEELATLLERQPVDESSIEDLTEHYGLTFDHSWLPDLQQRFGPLRMV